MTEPPARARSALAELTLARFRLFFREPSALFWTFGFPVILAVALGIAFRNRPPEPVHVAVQAGPGAEETLSQPRPPPIKASIEDAEQARRRICASARWRSSSSRASRAPTATTRRAPRRASRACSSTIASSGRRDAPTRRRRRRRARDRAGRAVHRLPRARPRRPDAHVEQHVGHRLRHRRAPHEEARQADARDADATKGDFLLSFVVMRALFVLVEVPVLVAFGWIAFGVRVNGSPAAAARRRAARRAGLRRTGAARRVARAEHADRRRADEPRDDADVRRVGRLLLRRRTSPTPCSPCCARCR